MISAMKNIAHEICDWLTGDDIARLHDEAVRQSVMRFSRGNTSIQAGRYMTQESLDNLRAKGDKAHQRIKARAA